jgi:dTDP-4-dehydrorhamnose 3,5-epimerase
MIKDKKTVDKNGVSIQQIIEGVELKKLHTISDERGSVCEMYDQRWGFHSEPLVYVYHVTIRPHKYKGWVSHKFQDDRSFFGNGDLKIVLFDGRQDSSTFQQINEFVVGTNNRTLLTIPAGVWHLFINIGGIDANFVNMPTKPYDHENPDKYRLDLKNDLIPYVNNHINSYE